MRYSVGSSTWGVLQQIDSARNTYDARRTSSSPASSAPRDELRRGPDHGRRREVPQWQASRNDGCIGCARSGQPSRADGIAWPRSWGTNVPSTISGVFRESLARLQCEHWPEMVDDPVRSRLGHSQQRGQLALGQVRGPVATTSRAGSSWRRHPHPRAVEQSPVSRTAASTDR
jgi:hypothetical protein